MKLHLPKALLTAVLAVCVAPAVIAADVITLNGSNNGVDRNLTDVWGTNGTFVRAASGTAVTDTIGTLTAASGKSKFVIAGQWNDANSRFESLTIDKFVVGDGTGTVNLQVGTEQGTSASANTIVINEFIGKMSALKLVNGSSLTISKGNVQLSASADCLLSAVGSKIIIGKDATLELTRNDTVDYNANAMFVTVDGGELKLGKTRQTLGKVTLTLNDGKVTSTAYGDGYGALDINNTNGSIVSTGMSSITGGVRLRTTGKFNVIDGTLTVDSIFNGDNKNAGIIKDGTGILKITSMASNTKNEAFYIGSTEMRGGAIEYALTSTGAYAGTIFGRGDIINSGSGTVTLSKVSNLDGNITVSAGVLNITSLAANKTIGVNVAEGAALNIGSVSLNQVYGDLQLDAVSATYSDNSAGTSTANGFRTGEVVLRLFDGYEWNGSIEGYTVSVQDGDTLVTTNAGDSSSTYYVNEGTHKISDSSDYVKEGAQGYSVAKDANLVIDGASGSLTAAQLLTGTLGDGNIILGTNITLTSGAATQISGNIIVNSGFDLKLGTQFSSGSAQQGVAVNIAGGIVLNGGQLSFCGDTTTLKSVTTQGAGSKIYIRDMYGFAGNAAGTFTIENLTLNADTEYQSSWKSNVEFKNLSGSGKLLLSEHDGGDKQMITIHAGKNYTGQLDLDGGADMSVYLNIAEGAKTRIKGDNDSTIAKLSFANNATLALDTQGNTTTSDEHDAFTYTLKAVEVDGTATVSVADSGAGWQAQVNIDSVTNKEGSASGKLNFTSSTKTTQRAIINLNGGDFDGEIALTGSSTKDDRKIALNINDDDVAKDAVITLNGNGSQVALAVGDDHVIVKGIKDAEVATGTMKIVSGAQAYSSADNFASDSTTRTLEINTNGGSYSTSAVLGANLNLKKSGSGTQTFTGSMANFNGAITVTEGKLALSSVGLSKNTGSFTATQNTGETILQFDVSSDMAIKDVSLKGGASLVFFNKGDTRVTDIEKLTIDGAGTVGTLRDANCHQGTINIKSLNVVGTTAELTLKNGSKTTHTTVYNLSGESTFKGTINLESDSEKGSSRHLQANLNSIGVAQNAVINFQDPSTDTTGDAASNNITLGVGVDGAKVAGLTGETTNAATIKATAGTKSLEIIAAANKTYETDAKVESSVNLVKSGKGTQIFTGAVNANSITLNDGELQLSGTVAASGIKINAGELSLNGTGDMNLGTVEVLSGALNIGSNVTLTADIKLTTGSEISLNGYESAAATIHGTVELGKGLELSGTVVDAIYDLKAGDKLLLLHADNVIFGDVNEAAHGEYANLAMAADAMIEATPLLESIVDVGTYFSSLNVEDYKLLFENGALYIQASNPIPEPTTATLSLLALAALAGITKRRRRK